MIIDIRDDGTTVVTFVDADEHTAVIAGLDNDRNHDARSSLYLGLLAGRAHHRQRRLDVYRFGSPDITPEVFARCAERPPRRRRTRMGESRSDK